MEFELEFELENIHLAILALTALVIAWADHDALAYVRGKKVVLDKRRVRLAHRLVWAGLIGMIVTGAIMAAPALSYWVSEPAFIAKMLFVLALVGNAFLIGALSHTATERAFTALSPAEKTRMCVSGAVSFIGWAGAAAIGFFVL